MQETIKLQNATIDAAAKAINVNLQRFLKEDVKQMKDTRGYFNKISNDLDGALNKNAGASKSRPTEVEDATNFLTATQGCFRYTTLDYVYQVKDPFWAVQRPILGSGFYTDPFWAEDSIKTQFGLWTFHHSLET